MKPIKPTSGENISGEVNGVNVATPAIGGVDQTVAKAAATVAISRPWQKKNIKPGKKSEQTLELPKQLHYTISYAIQQQAIETILFSGQAILQTQLGMSYLDNGTWLCIRFSNPINNTIPGELIIIEAQ